MEQQMNGKCVLVLAGVLQSEDEMVIKEYAAEGAWLIAVDGGADYLWKMGLKANLYIGDFDSASEKVKSILKDREEIEKVVLPCEKDDTDTLAALKEAIKRGYEEFYIFGGCGGRIDHTVANLQCLLFLRRKGFKGYLQNGVEKIWVLKNESIEFCETQRGILSLFSMGEKAEGVFISGMKYGLENGVVTNDFPIGISNEFIGEKGCVKVTEGELLVVLREIV